MSEMRKKLVLSLIPEVSSNILEIGCGQGELAQELKNLGHLVTGIDISEEALKEAKPFLVKSFAFDVDQPWPKDLCNMRFDMVIASEVIEHLFDTNHFLQQLHGLLHANGSLIITTPNFLFWKNRLKMLLGKFQYEEKGLLDFGHIRFFTITTARKKLQENRFKIERETHFYPNLYQRGLNWLGVLFPGFFAYQMIFLCRKQ